MLEEKDGNLQDPVGKEDEKVDKQTHHEKILRKKILNLKLMILMQKTQKM